MGRGLGKHNLSAEELRERKNTRNNEYYNQNFERLRLEERKKRAKVGHISCGCGGSYLNLPAQERRHFDTAKHQLYENELQVIELLNKLGFDDDEAITKINELCIKHDKYTTLHKCNYIGEELTKNIKKQIAKQESNEIKLEIKEY